MPIIVLRFGGNCFPPLDHGRETAIVENDGGPAPGWRSFSPKPTSRPLAQQVALDSYAMMRAPGATICLIMFAACALGQVCTPERISITYPQTARNEYIQGRLLAVCKIKRSGKSKIVRLSGIRVFAPAVRAAVRQASFGPDCRGREVEVLFGFQFDRELPPDSPVTAVRTSSGEIIVTAPMDPSVGSLEVEPYFIDERYTIGARLKRCFSRVLFWRD
jgi:hypothetical protein